MLTDGLETLAARACLSFDLERRHLSNLNVRNQDAVDARACVCWALRERKLTLKEIAAIFGYHDHQRVSILIRRAESTPRLRRMAQEIGAVQ